MSHAFRASRKSILAGLACSLLAVAAYAEKSDPAVAGRNYDARRTAAARPAVAPSAAQQSAIAALKARIPDLTVEVEPATGATRKIYNQVGFLTAADTSADNKQVALDYLAAHLDLLGISAADFANYEITDDVASRASTVRHLYLRQTLNGIPVYNGQLQIHVANDGRILAVNNLFLPDLRQRPQGPRAGAFRRPGDRRRRRPPRRQDRRGDPGIRGPRSASAARPPSAPRTCRPSRSSPS